MDFDSKITISNYSDIRSVYHSNYSNTKFHIRFSSSYNEEYIGLLTNIKMHFIKETDLKVGCFAGFCHHLQSAIILHMHVYHYPLFKSGTKTCM